jgi:hypothetical protein
LTPPTSRRRKRYLRRWGDRRTAEGIAGPGSASRPASVQADSVALRRAAVCGVSNNLRQRGASGQRFVAWVLRHPNRPCGRGLSPVSKTGDFCRFLHGLRRKNVLSIRASTAQPAPVAPRAGCAPGAQRRRPGSWSLAPARATMLGGGRRGPGRLWLLVSRREHG